MPSIEENRGYWDGGYAWADGGDEWSRDWGSPAMQWHGTISPRVHRFLPATTVLEIGCGYGRWTRYLADACDRLIGVDLSAECVEACRRRFADRPTCRFERNDGRSLAAVADGSVDLAFSFDALPLVDAATLRAYLGELARVLAPDGAAFLHHSNLGAYGRWLALGRRLRRFDGLLRRLGLAEPNLYWRDPGVDAESVVRWAEAVGLSCVSQEIFRWGTRRWAIEAFSVLARPGSRWDRPLRRTRNLCFDAEAANLRRLARLYDADLVESRA